MRLIWNGLLSITFAVGLASCAGKSDTTETAQADQTHVHSATCGHKGDCKVHGKHAHKHSATCGHHSVKHGDHLDYMHDGHKHAVHGDHIDDHQG